MLFAIMVESVVPPMFSRRYIDRVHVCDPVPVAPAHHVGLQTDIIPGIYIIAVQAADPVDFRVGDISWHAGADSGLGVRLIVDAREEAVRAGALGVGHAKTAAEGGDTHCLLSPSKVTHSGENPTK